MASNKEKSLSTKAARSQASLASRRKSMSLRQRMARRAKWFSEIRRDFLSRRPHRSFRLTHRRDYKRSLILPGYWSLTKQVGAVVVQNKKIFIGLALIYSVLTLLLSNIMSQDTYLQISDVVDESREAGLIGATMSNLALFWGVLTSQVTGNATASGSSQQIFGVLLGLYAWLAAVWLLRGVLAGKKLRLRDGVYSSGGPVIALAVLLFILLLQLLPAAVAIILYGAADTSGILNQTAMLMLFGGATVLMAVLSIYWITSTLFAMVIITLPGMYPAQALKLAGDIVVGRRMRILLRLLWAVALLLIVWVVILLPIIVIDGAVKTAVPGLEWVPLVPVTALLLTSFSIVFMASYTYIFYRKVVEDDAAPAR